MKQLLLYILIACLPVVAMAQKNNKDKVITELTEETCKCASGKDFSNMTRQQMELELGVCILKAINGSKNAKKVLDIDISDSENMGWLGEQIGMKMAEVCPQEILAIGLVAMDESDENGDFNDVDYPMAYEVKGTFKAVEQMGKFNFLVINNEDGDEIKLLWLGYFEGSDVLINAPEKAIGKKVSAEYHYVECYSPELKEYYDEMQVTYLQFLE